MELWQRVYLGWREWEYGARNLVFAQREMKKVAPPAEGAADGAVVRHGLSRAGLLPPVAPRAA